MPLVVAINSNGKTIWISKLATSSEMEKFGLVSFCVTMNSKRGILYILSSSPFTHPTNFLYFITAVRMDTGKIIQRIDLNIGNNYISPQCPILIGDEMLYFSWLTGTFPQSVPFRVIGIPQF